MEIKIKEIPSKTLFGQKISTSIFRQETSKLWRPFRKIIAENRDFEPKEYYSIQRYGKEMAEGTFGPETIFEKYAAIESSLINPKGFESIELEGGLYAVFEHSGTLEKFQKSMQEFLQNWLPDSVFTLDTRAHFETFDETYEPFSGTSSELIWIPIKRK